MSGSILNFSIVLLISIVFQSCHCVNKTQSTEQKDDDETGYSEAIILNNITFTLMSDKLLSSSYSSLDQLALKMREIPHLNIKIVSFCSESEDKSINSRLAFQRVKAIQEYLLTKNISDSRIILEGSSLEEPMLPKYAENGKKATIIRVYYRKIDTNEQSINPIILKDVKFGRLSDKLFASSNPALNKLIIHLKKNTNLGIKIMAYTDNDRDDDFMKKLSLGRAKAITDYLISKNIKSNRIIYEGFGNAHPIVPNDSPENKAINNRIESIFWNIK
jgi:outer membrane protein OmpA-like peptidoglycan-associated protein